MSVAPGYLVSTYVGARLPSLRGATPPDLCPICNRRRVPPESDDGLPPPEQWVYVCNGAYALPEDDDTPRVWEPYDFCGEVRTEQALAWLRDGCHDDAGFASVQSVLERAVHIAPPYRAKGASPLLLHLPTIDGEHTPEVCPVCGAEGRLISRGLHDYVCGARYRVTSESPRPDGTRAPRSWGPLSPCGCPPLAMVLHALQDRNESEWQSVCEEALAALPKP